MERDRVTPMGLDTRRRFSKVTERDRDGRIVCRQRTEHHDRGLWPKGTSVVREGTCGWGWLCDELKRAASRRLSPARPTARTEVRGSGHRNRKCSCYLIYGDNPTGSRPSCLAGGTKTRVLLRELSLPPPHVAHDVATHVAARCRCWGWVRARLGGIRRRGRREAVGTQRLLARAPTAGS